MGLVTSEFESLNAAKTDLVSRCPELTPALADLHEWMEGEEGIYNVFVHIIVPTLRYALAGVESGLEESLVSALPQWAAPEMRDFIMRLYLALDDWAASPSDHIRGAVHVELLEHDWPDLTVAQILGPAGPALLALSRSI